MDIRRRHIRTSDGIGIAVTEGGVADGPAILLIHGYLCSSRVYARQFAGKLASSYRIIAMDLRGHGDSGKPDDPSAYLASRRWADDVAAVLDAFALENAVIVGWSLGSRVALNYAWHYGFDRIAALDLVSATLATGTHDEKAGLPPLLADLIADDRERRERATRRMMDICAVPGGVDQAEHDRLVRDAMQVPLVARLGARSWPLPYDDCLSWIDVPTLVTNGVDDPTVPGDLTRSYADAIPGARLSLIPNAGHLVFQQAADRFDEDLLMLARSVSF